MGGGPLSVYKLQVSPHAGLALALVTPASGDLAPTAAGNGLLVINPSGGTSITVSLPLPASDGQTVTPRVITIPAGQTWLIPLPASVYGTANVPVTYTGTLTSVLAGLMAIPAN